MTPGLLRTCAVVAAVCALRLCPAAFSQQQANAGAPGYTLSTNANLVVVDVVVTGPDGKPVHGLKAADFSVLEDRAAQRIRNFQESVAPKAEGLPAAAPPRLGPGLFTNNIVTRVDGPVNVLLLDMLNTPLCDQAYARSQIRTYLDHAPQGTQVAIFGLSNTLTMLQGFTSDTTLLKQALDRKNAMKASSLLEDPLGGGGGDGGGATSVSDALATLGSTPDIQELVANAQQFESETQSFRFELRAQMTLDALQEIARYLSHVPGRKNLIWFSGSFPINLLPDTSTNNGFASMGSVEEQFHRTTNLLTQARVAIYPVDARGLLNSNTFSVTSSGAKYVRSPTAAGKDEAKFNQQLEADHGTMLQAAKDSGGRAFINTNGLSEAVAQAVSDGANFYTLTYSPTNHTQDGRFRKIAVSVAKPGYTLSYRQGYYADTGASSAIAATGLKVADDPTTRSAISRAMVHGAPVSTQIEFTVRVLPVTGEDEPAVAPGNELAVVNSAAKPPFLRFAVDFAIDPKNFSFSQQDGSFKDAIQVVTFVYDQNGNLVNRCGATLQTDFKAAVYSDFLKHPFSYNQDISVPHKGVYYLRIAIRDGNSDRTGAVEIPVEAVRHLQPLAKDPAIAPAK